MIALPPVDPADFIMRAGDEMQKCINEYFNEITLEEATQSEMLDQKYAPELLGELRAEYIGKLRRIWNSVPSPSLGGFDENYKAPPVEAAGDLDVLEKAYQAALKRTLRERLSKDYKDVVAYKRLLKEYGERLLWAMHDRFVKAVSDI